MGAYERALADNRANWDERADLHVTSEMYDVDGLLRDPSYISEVVLNDLDVLSPHLASGTIKGMSLLHLQCHIGTDTVSWARLGADGVHGLDLSPNSLTHARRIAEAAAVEIEWAEGDARTASDVIDRTFDVIVTSAGTIVWLPELETWARSISDLLAPGGLFMIRDDHPILAAMEFQPWTITSDYLSGGGELVYEDAGTYTGDESGITRTTNHEWRHSLAEVTRALLNAGLVIEAIGEHPYMDWPAFPDLVPCKNGWALPENSPQIPLNFSVVARQAKQC